jgi:hypothetical protein
MAIHHLPVIRLAAILALTAASASVFAQSTEYRRGYADGLVAGKNAALAEQGQGRHWPRVHVEEAEYGARGMTCDAIRAVRNEVERNDGNVHAGNHLCGDPARGQPKRLRIVYRCGDSEAMRVVLRENEIARLTCRQ